MPKKKLELSDSWLLQNLACCRGYILVSLVAKKDLCNFTYSH